MVCESKAKEIDPCPFFGYSSFAEVNDFSNKKETGDFTIQQRKKKREIIEERGHQVNVPPDVGEEEKKALNQTGDDATQGW